MEPDWEIFRAWCRKRREICSTNLAALNLDKDLALANKLQAEINLMKRLASDSFMEELTQFKEE
jgi:hypothetical protein